MFCGKCGAENLDGVTFCKECGAPLNGSGSTKQKASRPAASQSNRRNKKVGILAVAVAAIVVIVLLFALLGGRSYKAAVEQYVDIQYTGNMGELVDLVPDEVWDHLLARDGYDEEDLDVMLAETTELAQDQLEDYDEHFGADWEVSYQILSAEDVDAEELADLQERYEALGVDVSKAKTVEVEVTIQGSKSETSDTMDISLMKSGRSWYLDVQQLGGLF